MDGQEIAGAGGGQGGGRLFYRRADIVQLPVGENLTAAALQVTGHGHAVGGEQLQADLVETDGVAQLFDQGLGVGACRYVEGDDNPRIAQRPRLLSRRPRIRAMTHSAGRTFSRAAMAILGAPGIQIGRLASAAS